MSLSVPVEQIRAAIAAQDWDAADALLDAHDADVRAYFSDPTRQPSLSECARVFAVQQALMAELAAARDATSDALRRLHQDRRGVSAYLGAGA